MSLQSIILIIYSFLFKFKISYFSNENTILVNNKSIKHKIKILFIKTISNLLKKKIFKIFCYTNQIKDNLKKLGYNKNNLIPVRNTKLNSDLEVMIAKGLKADQVRYLSLPFNSVYVANGVIFTV